MKKLMYTSGIITVLLLSLILIGWADADGNVQKALIQGNQQYTANRYEEALISYEAGLAANQENKILNFNAAQAAYTLGEYERAVIYYDKSEKTLDKYLNAGNASFWLGESESDAEKKLQFYAYALQVYQEGIFKYPQDVSLKYNYEFVKQKLEELLENKEQESGEGEESESEESEGEDGEGENGEQSQSQESQEQENASEGEQGEEEQESPDQEAIERILKMLESQEEESLKNNQDIVGGKDGENGW